MSIHEPCAREVRQIMTRVRALAPADRDPSHYSTEKDEIVAALGNVAQILEGDYDINPPAAAHPPLPRSRAPYTIEDRKGNVIRVEMRNQRLVRSDNTPGRDTRS